ncbi:hypothetical protein SmJEL517_g05638 [Synchytrium microbalum]|uniref:Uncharacterized protein n=1 Tax=Synchytrium microbalum TaxID=1806994 RepID=A0A507C014_9FUNG|nr:uncharacterized protein SmJEL517_g05638 [Synchytrium microbalum]TPX30863.1 hypothetical protein SmJEL517_g05638 [Synchytrium microbalum]
METESLVRCADTVLMHSGGNWMYGEVAADLTRNSKLISRDLEHVISTEEAVFYSKQAAGHLLPNVTHKPAVESVYYVSNHHIIEQQPQIVPAYRVLDVAEPIQTRRIRYIDATTGSILSSIPTLHKDSGNVYTMPSFVNYRPPTTAPSAIVLPDVSGASTTNGGYGIFGKYFRSMNTCFAYKCNPGATLYGTNGSQTPGACNEDGSMCVDPTSNMTAGFDYNTTEWFFTIDGKFIDFDRNWTADGYENGALTLVWRNAPIFAPRLKFPANGIWGSDTNFAQYYGTEQTDSFSELQVYYLMNLHLSFMRNLTNDNNSVFCFFGSGPTCNQIDPKSNRTATVFDTPLKFTTNLQNLVFTPSPGSSHPDFFTQLSQGLGKNHLSPIAFYEAGDYADAYYTYSGFIPPNATAEFRDCTGGACLSIYSSYLDFFAFGQTSLYDWGLNACIVMHEMTHAWTQKIIPDLPSFVWTSQGLISDPGALNEGWSDYFAFIHCGLADFTKSYTGTPRRSLINTLTCADTVGEVHADRQAELPLIFENWGMLTMICRSQIFTGALYDIRVAIPQTASLSSADQTSFDQVVLQAQALAQASDTFVTQMTKILTLLENHTRLNVMVSVANETFSRRVFNCQRVTAYDETKDSTLFIGAADTNLQVSTTPTQFLLSPRVSDFGARISWSQWYLSPILGPLSIGKSKLCHPYKSVSISLALNLTVSNITAFDSCSLLPLSWTTATLSPSNLAEIRLSFDPGAASRIYIWVFNTAPATLVLYSMSLQWEGFSYLWLKTIAAIGFLGVLISLILLVIVVWRSLRFWRAKPMHASTSRNNTNEVTSMENLTTTSSASLPSPAPSVPRKSEPKTIIYAAFQIASTLAMATVATLGLIFGPFRSVSIVIALAITIIPGLVDILHSYRKTGLWRKVLISSSSVASLSALAAIPSCVLASTPVAAHAVLYSIFIVSVCGRFLACILIVFSI